MIRTAIKVLFICFMLSSCSKQTAEHYISEANKYIGENKVDEAEIILKTAITDYPTDAKIRIHLGTLYLNQGLAAFAEKEFNRAIELGTTSPDTQVAYVRSLYMQHKIEDILSYSDEILANSSNLNAALATFRGIAFFEQRLYAKSRRSFNNVRDLQEEGKYSLLSAAYLALLNNTPRQAIEQLEGIVSRTPTFAEALILKGQLHFQAREFTLSANTFEQYIENYPNNYWARLYYAQSLVRAGQFDKANTEVVRLLALFPNQSLLNQLKSAIEFEKGNYQLAKDHAEQSLQSGGDQDTTRFIAGVSSMRLGNYEQAYSYLEGLVQKMPTDHPIHKIFAIAQYKVGYLQAAAETLENNEAPDNGELDLYAAISYGLIKEGNVTQARNLIERANEVAGDEPSSLTQMGMLKLSIEDLSGIDDLVRSLEQKPDQAQAKLMLATAYINENKFNEALSLATQWQKESPKEVEAYNLEAYTHFKQRNFAKAELIYKNSLNLDPSNFRAHLYLKNKYVLAENYELASKQLETYLKLKPTDSIALVHLYLVKKAQGDTQDIISRIRKTYDQSPSSRLRLILAKIYNAENQFSTSADFLSLSIGEENLSETFWQTLTESLLNMDDFDRAIKTTEIWKNNFPNSGTATLFKTLVLERNGNFYSALETVKNWNIKQASDSTLVTQVMLEVKMNRFNDAEATLQKISQSSLSSPTGMYLLGRVEANEGNHIKAKEWFSKSYTAINKPEYAAWLAEQVKEVEGIDKAIVFLDLHLNEFPNDIVGRTQLANLLIKTNVDRAATEYEQILKLSPKSLIALNNLAWIAKNRGELTEAEEYANEAIKYAGDFPDILDTAAAIKVELGQVEAARELLERAYKTNTKNNDIAMHYARVLIQLNETTKAKDILKKITPRSEQQEKQKIELINTLES